MQASLLFIFALLAGAIAWLRTLESPPEKFSETGGLTTENTDVQHFQEKISEHQSGESE